MSFTSWRVLHRTASGTVAAFAILHSGFTPVLFSDWSADAVWFLGTGLGLLLLAVSNWAHIGLGPCDLPTAPVVRWSNLVFVLFGIGAVIAVPETQAFIILAALAVQAAAGFVTLKRSPNSESADVPEAG